MITKRNDCRLCHSQDLDLYLDLGSSALANEFVPTNVNQAVYPLKVYVCNNCEHYQLLDIVEPSKLFKNYHYVSGTSEVMRRHFRNYACDIISDFDLNPDDLIVDIGSNDGTLLNEFIKHEFRVVGIEPAENIPNKYGVPIYRDFFNKKLAIEILDRFGEASVITCNNCFAHIDNLDEIMHGVLALLKRDGIFCMEASYFIDVFKNNDFTQIYHEHLSYHTITPLKKFFAKYDMEIIRVNHPKVHGGSLRLIMKRKRCGEYLSKWYVTEREEHETLNEDNESFPYWTKKKIKINPIKDKLLELKSQGKTIVGACAAAKSTTFLHYHDIGPDILDFIVDDAKEKIYLLSPGKHIPIKPFSALYTEKPDYVLILSHNFGESVIKNHKEFLKNGGVFIVPFPEYKEIRV